MQVHISCNEHQCKQPRQISEKLSCALYYRDRAVANLSCCQHSMYFAGIKIFMQTHVCKVEGLSLNQHEEGAEVHTPFIMLRNL
jgi:hypothetical protein